MQGDEWLAPKGEGRWGAGRGERVGPVGQQRTLAARREQRGGSCCTLVLEHVQVTAGRRRRTLVARRESARARAYAMSVGARGCGPYRPRRRGPCDAAAPPSCRLWRQSEKTPHHCSVLRQKRRGDKNARARACKTRCAGHCARARLTGKQLRKRLTLTSIQFQFEILWRLLL